MEEKKSRFAMALEKLSNKTKDVVTNVYLSQNPKSDLYCEDHIDHLNKNLRKHGYKIVKNEMQGGEWIEYGYQVQSFIPSTPSGEVKKKTVFFTESPSKLDAYLANNLSNQLGWKVPEQSAVHLVKPAIQTKVRTLQPTMSI
jgi:hypothetical protein